MTTASFIAIDFDAAAQFPSAAAQIATAFRRSVVEPHLQNTLQRIPANNPTDWSDVADEFTNQVIYVTGSGDGSEGAFPSPPGGSVLPPDSFSTNLLEFRIIHLLACNTGLGLGPDLVRLGKAAAFIGYRGVFFFPDPNGPAGSATFANVFFNCDAQIDYALAEGLTVGAALQQAQSEFEKQAKILDGINPFLANHLRNNAALLCGPTIDNEYGTASASFALSLQQLGGAS